MTLSNEEGPGKNARDKLGSELLGDEEGEWGRVFPQQLLMGSWVIVARQTGRWIETQPKTLSVLSKQDQKLVNKCFSKNAGCCNVCHN